MIRLLTTKVLGGALAGSLILSGILGVQLAFTKSELSSAKEVIQDLTSWRDDMIGSIRLATGSPDTDAKTAKMQVQALGQAHTALKETVKSQNSAIAALEQGTLRAKQAAAREASARAAAINRAEDLEAELVTRVPRQDVEAAVREVQDMLYEAGL